MDQGTVVSLPSQDTSTREDLGMLAVMEALVEDEEVTQRELSRRSGLHLKKVNYCLHKLLEKGQVRFQRVMNSPNKRAYLYVLTPAGLQEKSRLTYRFLKVTLGYYNQVEEKLEQCLAEMGRAGVRRVILYGASDAARIVMGLVGGNGIRAVGVVDDGLEVGEFSGVPVVAPGDVSRLGWDGMLVTALDNLDAVDDQIEKLGLPESRVWRLK